MFFRVGPRVSLFAVLLAVFLLLNGHTAAQTPASQESSQADQHPSQSQSQKPGPVYENTTVLRTVTRLVEVDVVVTDAKGQPVNDLRQEDFTLTEDGQAQQIRGFSFQQPPASGSPLLRERRLNLPPNIFTNIPKYSPESALNVLLLDGLNTTLSNQAYAREQMLKFLETLPQGQAVAVYALGSKLRLLQDFTTDPRMLQQAVKDLQNHTSPLLGDPAAGTALELLPPGAPAQMVVAMQRFEADVTAFQTDLRVRYTVDAMNALARALAGYPGRKNLIWISEAFPISIDPDFMLNTGNVGGRNYSGEVAEAAEHLIDAQVAIYPVDARGLVGYSFFSGTNTGRSPLGQSVVNGGKAAQQMRDEAAEWQTSQGTMQEIADRTGGRAFYNRNDLEGAIRESVADGSTYYSLGYYPGNKYWDGRFRRIQIKVNRPGVHVRHRLGYFALDLRRSPGKNPKNQYEPFTQALSLDFPVSTGLRFEAGVVQPSQKTHNHVLVNFGLDPHAVSFEKTDDGLQHANFDCAVQAFTDKGKQVKLEATTTNASFNEKDYASLMQSFLRCQQPIDLAPGNYILRLGVIDNRTGLIGTANATVAIKPPS